MTFEEYERMDAELEEEILQKQFARGDINALDLVYGRAASEGRLYRDYGDDPRVDAGRLEYAKEREAKEFLYYKPGVHTRAFRGYAKPVQTAVSKFHETMFRKYDKYKIIDMSPVQLADSTCMYVTFEVGNIRKNFDDVEVPAVVVNMTI